MKTGIKNKIVSLITTIACVITFMTGVLPVVSAEGGNWTAFGSNASTVVIAENGTVADIIAGDHQTAGVQLTNKFAPIKTGKWAFTFNLKSEGTAATWGSLSFTWAAYGTTGEPNSAVLINNGIRFNFVNLNTPGANPYVEITNGDNSAFTAIGNPSITLDTEHRVVIEAINGTISVYLDGTKIGDFQSEQGYYTNASAVPSLAIGGGDAMHFVINSAPGDTTLASLNTLLTECNTLHDNTISADYPVVGQVSTAAKAAFKAAIDDANAKAAGSETDMLAAIASLNTAKATFENAVVSSDIKKALKDAVAEATALLKKLAESGADYTALNTLITEGQAIIDNVAAEQAEIDAKATALTDKIAAVKGANLIFTVDNLTADEPTGVSVKSDKNTVTITTSNKDGKLYTWAHARISAQIAATSKLTFSLKETQHVVNQWSNFYLYKTLGANNLTGPALRVTFGGNNNGYVEAYTNLETPVVTLASFAFQNNEDIQFSFEKTEAGKLLIRINGLIVFEGDSELVDILNGTDAIYLGYANGTDANGGQETVLVLEPENKLAVEKGEFIATGQSGSGSTDKVTVTKNEQVQSIIFSEAIDFTDGIARAVVGGPALNFSFKIAQQGENDWATILFSNNIDIHAANTPGLAIKIGGDLSVSAAEYGQSGMGGSSIWETDPVLFFTQVGLKMIVSIYEEDGKIIVKVNDTILTEDQEMTESLRALLNSENINMTLLGATEEGSQYDLSYINEEDPEPFDQPQEPEPEVIDPEIISLNDMMITIDGTTITILEDLTIDEFLGLITFDESFTLILLDSDGNEIVDADVSVSKLATIKMMLGDEEAASFTISTGADGENDGNQTGDSGDDITDTGVATCTAAMMLLMLSAAAVLFFLKKKAHN